MLSGHLSKMSEALSFVEKTISNQNFFQNAYITSPTIADEKEKEIDGLARRLNQINRKMIDYVEKGIYQDIRALDNLIGKIKLLDFTSYHKEADHHSERGRLMRARRQQEEKRVLSLLELTQERMVKIMREFIELDKSIQQFLN